MSTDISTTKRRRPWACSAGHNHQTKMKAALCEAERIVRWWRDRPAWVVSFEQARARFRPIPDDERDPLERRVERGQANWGAVLRGAGAPALGVVAAMACIVVPVALEGALQYAVVHLIAAGHDEYLLAAVAAVAVVGVGISVVRQPRAKAMWAWVREMYR